MRRIGCLVLIFFFSIFLLGGVTWRLLFGGARRDEGPPVHALWLLIPLALITWAIVRSLRRTAEPIGAVMEAANRVADGDYGARVEPHGSPDVQRLISSFNAMATRLQANEEQRRMLLADIAHELRNPLAMIRGNVEGMIDGVYARDENHLAPLLKETVQMARLLDDLQTFSSVEAGKLQLHGSRSAWPRVDPGYRQRLTDPGRVRRDHARGRHGGGRRDLARSRPYPPGDRESAHKCDPPYPEGGNIELRSFTSGRSTP